MLGVCPIRPARLPAPTRDGVAALLDDQATCGGVLVLSLERKRADRWGLNRRRGARPGFGLAGGWCYGDDQLADVLAGEQLQHGGGEGANAAFDDLLAGDQSAVAQPPR